MIKTRLTELLDLQYPIISAPMARHSGGMLAAAVSNGGGLGTFGGIDVLFSIDADYIRDQIGLVRERTERPFGVGFITHLLGHDDRNFDQVLDEKVPVVLFSFADPRPWLGKVKASGVFAICQVQDLDAARLAVEEGADVLAIQGNESGGHHGELNLLPFLAQALEAFPETPIVAAGGIASARSLAAVLAAGADGAWIGTAFVAVTEATEIPPALRNRILDSDGRDTVRSPIFDILATHIYQAPQWPQGIKARVRKNQFLDRWLGKEEEMLDQIEELVPQYVAAREAGVDDIAPSHYGESAGFVQRVQSAEAFMRGICAEAEDHLEKAAGRLSHDPDVA